jgi:hypothetical protein
MEPKIIIPYKISRKFIQQHTEWIFLYGHDYWEKGCLGQSWEFYNEPNTFPIYTMYKNCSNSIYFSEIYEFREIVDKGFLKIPIDARPIIPCRKIGEGCSRLREFAPQLLKHIQETIKKIQYPNFEYDYH